MTAHPRIIHAHSGVELLDLRPAQDVIREKYGYEYHRNEACLWEIAALWGVKPQHECINDAGVFTSSADAVRVSTGRSHAEIAIAISPSGLCAMDTCFWTPTYGASAAPSVWNAVAYLSEDDARRAGLAKLIELCRAFAAREGGDTTDARKMVALLEAEKMPQLRLF